MSKRPPNGIAINVGDTAQLDPIYVLDLLDQFDMAQLTVIEATHTDKARSLAYEVRKRRPQTGVIYRKWKNNLKDEEFPVKITAQEWVNYFREQLEWGCICAAYNEALTNPFSRQNDFSKAILDLTVPNGWRSMHYKIATGNPGGYANEHLRTVGSIGYRPDEFGMSKPLFDAMVKANKPVIDAGGEPLAWLGNHGYFAINGPRAGHTDRYKVIYERVMKDVNPKYLPMAAGETGIVQFDSRGGLDAEAGFLGLIDPDLYADVFSEVYKSDFKPYNVIAHLYMVGDQQRANNAPGQWFRFDLMKKEPFWKRLAEIAARGVFRLPYWYGKDYNTVIRIAKPENAGPGVKMTLQTSQSWLNIRSTPGVQTANDIGDVRPGEVLTIYPLTRTVIGSLIWWYTERESAPVNQSSNGWMAFRDNEVPAIPEPEPEPPTPPVDPNPDSPAPDVPPGEEMVRLSYTIRYDVRRAAVDDHKTAISSLMDFLGRVTVDGYDNNPSIVVTESPAGLVDQNP